MYIGLWVAGRPPPDWIVHERGVREDLLAWAHKERLSREPMRMLAKGNLAMIEECNRGRSWLGRKVANTVDLLAAVWRWPGIAFEGFFWHAACGMVLPRLHERLARREG